MNPTTEHETGELLEHITKLESQLKERDATIARLEKSFTTISHDFKTPLTVIKLFADIIFIEMEEAHNTSQNRYLVTISSEAERLGRMITNLVDMQKLRNGTGHWNDEKADLAQLTATAVRQFKRWCSAKGIGFDYESNVENLIMMLDTNRVTRLLSILLTNALRFTEAGTVKMELRRDGERAILKISDNGPGIAKERLNELLHPDRAGLDKDIGFAFAHCLVNHYHGKLQAESEPGKGTSVHIELPLQP